ncbi:hypothetical protein EDB84DRAFT_1445515 [Lactarius hengduanensis]|nr:hypothetical protein EDB84DRAFT_1445515 [Lactarius hengduanensis]
MATTTRRQQRGDNNEVTATARPHGNGDNDGDGDEASHWHNYYYGYPSNLPAPVKPASNPYPHVRVRVEAGIELEKAGAFLSSAKLHVAMDNTVSQRCQWGGVDVGSSSPLSLLLFTSLVVAVIVVPGVALGWVGVVVGLAYSDGMESGPRVLGTEMGWRWWTGEGFRWGSTCESSGGGDRRILMHELSAAGDRRGCMPRIVIVNVIAIVFATVVLIVVSISPGCRLRWGLAGWRHDGGNVVTESCMSRWHGVGTEGGAFARRGGSGRELVCGRGRRQEPRADMWQGGGDVAL